MPATVRGDASTQVLSGVVVEEAWAFPAQRGGELRLKFRIENASGRALVLEGVSSPLAESGLLLMVEKGFYDRPMEQLFVADQEVLELDTSHFTAVLTGLSRTLAAGEVIDFELVFRSGVVPAQAHVHDRD